MINVAIVGCNGKMGHFVAQAVKDNSSSAPMFGIDAFGESSYDFPVYKSFADTEMVPDVIIDFSNLLFWKICFHLPLTKKSPA